MTDRTPVPGRRTEFRRANDESRERLVRLVASLTPSLLEVDLGAGWTVASALGHMGFWDRWQAERWTRMLAGTWTAETDSVLAAEDLANDALHAYWAGVSAEDVPSLAVEAAAHVDALIASAPEALVDSLEGTSIAFLLHRHRHRDEHLDHIERVLAAAAVPLDRSFVERNAAGRRRLAALVERLRDSDLTLPTEEGGWTVAQVLGHMAFWDHSMAARWRAAAEAAGETGAIEPVYLPSSADDAINPAIAEMLASWTARLGAAVGSEALAAAETADIAAEELAGRAPAAYLARNPRTVNRWLHREAHIDQIERVLSTARPAAAPVDRAFVARNEASLAGLRGLLGRLSAADLAESSGAGSWTVGQILGHLAFWDRFLASRWRAALAAGPGGQPTFLPHELADLINGGLPATWLAFAAAAPEAAIAETLSAAEEIDAIIAALPESAAIGVVLAERPALLDRSTHRREHVAEIEKALAARRG